MRLIRNIINFHLVMHCSVATIHFLHGWNLFDRAGQQDIGTERVLKTPIPSKIMGKWPKN
jgi:hypothetical protein